MKNEQLGYKTGSLLIGTIIFFGFSIYSLINDESKLVGLIMLGITFIIFINFIKNKSHATKNPTEDIKDERSIYIELKSAKTTLYIIKVALLLTFIASRFSDSSNFKIFYFIIVFIIIFSEPLINFIMEKNN